MPYLISTIVYSNNNDTYCSVNFRNKPISSLDDSLFQVGLPHISSNRICLHVENKDKSANGVVNSFFNVLFNQTFVIGYHFATSYAAAIAHGTFKSISDWERKSKKNPDWVMGDDVWPRASCNNKPLTVKTLINEFLGVFY